MIGLGDRQAVVRALDVGGHAADGSCSCSLANQEAAVRSCFIDAVR